MEGGGGDGPEGGGGGMDGGFDGGGWGGDYAGVFDGGAADAGAPGQTAPGPGGSPGLASSGTGLSLSATGLGLSASFGAGLALNAPAATGLQISDSAIAGFGPSAAPGLGINTDAAVTAAQVSLANAAATVATAAAKAAAAQAAAQAATVRTVVNMIPGGALVSSVISGVQNLLGAFGIGTSSSDAAPSMATSGTPDLTGPGAIGADLAMNGFAGNTAGGMQGDFGGVQGAPVMGFGGATINDPGFMTLGPVNTAPVFTPGGGSLGPLFSFGPYPGGRYAAPRAAAAAQSDVAPLVVLAGLASLLFMG